MTQSRQISTADLATGGLRSRDIVIVGIGDSHMNGQMPVASGSDGATDPVGLTVAGGANDFVWGAGDAVASYFKADSQINSKTNSQDPNLGLSTTNPSFIQYFPRLLRDSCISPRDITLANLGIGGASWATWNGEGSWAWTKAVALPTNGDTITVDGVVYTFVTAVATANDVLIGVSANATMTNLSYAINTEGGTVGVNYGIGTTLHPTCWVPTLVQLPHMKIFVAAVGAAGNGTVISASNTGGITPSNGSLTPVASIATANGSDTSAVYENGKAAIASIGNVDAFVITLGTNDAKNAGFRGRGITTNCTGLLDAIHTDFPNAKVIVSTGPTLSSGTSNTVLGSVINPAVLAAISARSAWASYVDIYSLGVGSGNVTIVNPINGIHLTTYGYQIWASLFVPALKTSLGMF